MPSAVLTVSDTSTRPEERGLWIKWLAPLLFGVVAAVVLISGILSGRTTTTPSSESSVSSFAGGLLPYRDAWDHKPPAT